MTKTEMPSQAKITAPTKGSTWLKGGGSSESGKDNRPATTNPTIRPIMLEISTAAGISITRLRIATAGRVVK